jgi:hypothetical protein
MCVVQVRIDDFGNANTHLAIGHASHGLGDGLANAVLHEHDLPVSSARMRAINNHHSSRRQSFC